MHIRTSYIHTNSHTHSASGQSESSSSSSRENLNVKVLSKKGAEDREVQPNLDAFVIRGKCPDSRAKRITELIADMVPGIFVQPLWWKEMALKHC